MYVGSSKPGIYLAITPTLVLLMWAFATFYAHEWADRYYYLLFTLPIGILSRLVLFYTIVSGEAELWAGFSSYLVCMSGTTTNQMKYWSLSATLACTELFALLVNLTWSASSSHRYAVLAPVIILCVAIPISHWFLAEDEELNPEPQPSAPAVRYGVDGVELGTVVRV